MPVERIQCRNCGEMHLVMLPERPVATAPAGSWSPIERRRVGMGDMPAIPAFTPAEYERLTPTRPASIGSDVGVPALSALITAVALTGVFGVAAWAWSLPAWLVALGGLLAFLFVWVLLSGYYRSLLVQSEYQRTEPAPVAEPPTTKRVRLQVDEKNTRKIADLPIDVDRLVATARAVHNGRAFSVASLTGRGKPLSRSEFVVLRDWLIANRYAAWVNESNRQAGVEFTRRGEALLRGLAE